MLRRAIIAGSPVKTRSRHSLLVSAISFRPVPATVLREVEEVPNFPYGNNRQQFKAIPHCFSVIRRSRLQIFKTFYAQIKSTEQSPSSELSSDTQGVQKVIALTDL
jgi:hypothetical protein